jgi:hypothetical protein
MSTLAPDRKGSCLSAAYPGTYRAVYDPRETAACPPGRW